MVYILSFVADVPFEDPNEQSSVPHVLPFVSKQFHSMCQSNYFWQMALERLVVKDPSLWKEGLLKLYSSCDESSPHFVRLVHEGLLEPGYASLYRMVVDRFLRFTGPVFMMSGVVSLGEPILLHFFEPRYRLLVQQVLEGYPQEAREGGPITANENGDYPTFVYAHMAPFAPTFPACLVEIRQCTVQPNGSADVMLMPVAYVRIQHLWERPNTGRLHFAQCIRMGGEESRQLEERAHARIRGTFENPLIEMLLQQEDHHRAMQGPMRAMLAYLVNEHGILEEEDEVGIGMFAD